MISLPKMGLDEMNFFQGKKVVIYGNTNDKQVKELYNIYRFFGIEVVGVYEERHVYRIKSFFEKFRVINIRKIKKLCKKNQIVIQSSSDETSRMEYKEKFEGLKVEFSPFFGELIIHTFLPMVILNEIKDKDYVNHPYNIEKDVAKAKVEAQLYRNPEVPIIICNPPKTADVTLNKTFDYLNRKYCKKKKLLHLSEIINQFYWYTVRENYKILQRMLSVILKFDVIKREIDYINVIHQIEAVDLKLYKNKKIKIITAVREPISTNLSGLFQRIGGPSRSMRNFIYNRIAGLKDDEKTEMIEYLENLLVENSDNIQKWFDDDLSYNIYTTDNNAEGAIQQFIPKFQEYILDILEHPFDVERGFTIIRKDNIEIFVYQLEKLNSVIPELSEWIGIPFDKLVNANESSNKWVGKCYKETLNNIKITDEYFEQCYNEPYVKYFYSNQEIEKFKNKWKSHIKK